MDVTIEPFAWAGDLAPSDLAANNRIHNAAWAEWLPGERPVSDAALVDMDRFSAPPERMEKRLARAADGTVVGFAFALLAEGEPGGCTLRTFVDAAHRRQGVGRALGADLVEAARAAGRTGITVEVARAAAPRRRCARPTGSMPAGRGAEPHRCARHRPRPPRALARGRGGGRRVLARRPTTGAAPPTSWRATSSRAREVMNDAPRPEGMGRVALHRRGAARRRGGERRRPPGLVERRRAARRDRRAGRAHRAVPAGQPAVDGLPGRHRCPPRPPRAWPRRLDEGGQPPAARRGATRRRVGADVERRRATSRCCGSTGRSGSRRCSGSRAGTGRSRRYPDATHEGELGEPG